MLLRTLVFGFRGVFGLTGLAVWGKDSRLLRRSSSQRRGGVVLRGVGGVLLAAMVLGLFANAWVRYVFSHS